MRAEHSVDPSVLGYLLELDERDGSTFHAEIAGLFTGQLPGRLAELHRALLHADVALAARVVHSVKGSCGGVGATRMVELCKEIEGELAHEQVLPAIAAVDRLRAEYEIVAHILGPQPVSGPHR